MNLRVEEDEGVVEEEVVVSLGSVKAIQTLDSLEIMVYDFPDPRVAYNELFNFCDNLKFLTHLTFRSSYANQVGVYFINLLQNLLSLESLVFDSLTIFDRYIEDRMILSKMDGVK